MKQLRLALLEARVEPIALPLSDPLARIDGLLNAIVIQTDTPQQVTVIGPGAGRFQAGQGMLADLIAIAKQALDRLFIRKEPVECLFGTWQVSKLAIVV